MIKIIQNVTKRTFTTIQNISRTLTIVLVALYAAFGVISVQAQQQTATNSIDEVVVTGTRATIQSSIDIKRKATQIVDGLSADEIGAIPALSIGAALETITGATSHRENGGATEVSVRGLGPFLGTTVVNGREATNGGGNRAVNFSIFPSEMFNKIAIHKSQSAEYIEGAVSGQIHLDTKRPLEYGKQLLQANLKGAYNVDEANIDGGKTFGSRATLAYIDQFVLSDGSGLGVSLGIQQRDESNPEQEYHTTSGGGRLEACELESFNTDALPTNNSGRCHGSSGGSDVSNDAISDLIAENSSYTSVTDIPFAYIPRDHRYRQNTTDDKRQAIFGAIQWEANAKLDIMLDFQMSERDQRELRKDLQFGTTQENITKLTSNPRTGVVGYSESLSNILAYTTDFQRLEQYSGFGLNVDYQINDNLKINFDYGYSDTKRTETDVELRLGASSDKSRFVEGDYHFLLGLDVNDGGAGIATILNNGGNGFEVTDPSFFNATERARIRARQIIRDNILDAFRTDLEWDREDSAIHTVKAGLRVSSQEYFTRGGDRNATGESLFEYANLVPNGASVTDAEQILTDVLACADSSFPEAGFLADVRDTNLITNQTGSSVNSYATFDYQCAANKFLVNYGGINGIQFQNGISSATNDIIEDTFAYYLQGDFAFVLMDYPVRGNIGMRLVDTDITSTGYRAPITVRNGIDEAGATTFLISSDSSAELETDTQNSGYVVALPSLTAIVDLNEKLLLRGAIFRGMSRPDPNAYGNGRNVQPNTDSNPYFSLAEAVNSIAATGNPY